MFAAGSLLVATSPDKQAVFSAGDPRFLVPVFQELSYKGVRSVEKGYAGDVLAIRVTYDDSKCSYKELLGTFWRNVDPTQKDQQFPLGDGDRGPRFQSVVWVNTDEERRIATKSMEILKASGIYSSGEFATRIADSVGFEPTTAAEDAKDRQEDLAKLSKKSGRTKFFVDTYKPRTTTACADGVCGYVYFPCTAENGCQLVVSGTW